MNVYLLASSPLLYPQLGALLGFVAVALLTPGPNNVMLMTSGANYGFRRTLPHMTGVNLGFVAMVAIVALGLSRIFDVYPLSYTVLRVLSVAYLLYLAFRIATATPAAPVSPAQTLASPTVGPPPTTASETAPTTRGTAPTTTERVPDPDATAPKKGAPATQPLTFLQAALFQWVNPKAWAIVIASLSIYAPDHTPLQVFVLVTAFALMGCISTTSWAYAGIAIQRFLLARRDRLRIFNMAMAALLLASLIPMLLGEG